MNVAQDCSGAANVNGVHLGIQMNFGHEGTPGNDRANNNKNTSTRK